MNGVYYGSTNLKKAYLKKWVESKSDYKKRKNVAKVFKIVALIVLIICITFPTLLLLGNDTIFKGFIAGTAVGIIFSLIPFAIGDSIKIKAFKEYSFPFENKENECLKVYEDGLEYLYHDTSNRFPESMNVYRIPMENINAVNYDKEFHIITIIGEAEMLAYDDYAEKRLNHQKSQRKFYSNSPYPIILSFEEGQQIVLQLKNMAKNKTE